MAALISIPDLLRLLTLPVFGWIAVRDIRTRRVPNRIWYPLAALGVVLIVWEGVALFTGTSPAFYRERFLIQVGVSIGFLIPISYGFWLIGGFGGADAKAFFTVAILFPTYPAIQLGEVVAGLPSIPIVHTTIGVFSLTILSNTVVAGIVYPLGLAVRNALTGYVSPGMFVARPVAARAAVDYYGSMLEFPDRSFTDDLSPSGIRGYFSWRGLDLDALRMYLQWRGADLADLQANPAHYRDPGSLPDDPNPPGDGSMAAESRGTATADELATDDREAAGSDGTPPDDGGGSGAAAAVDADSEDPWGARAFLADIDHSAYGTDPEVLREGLDSLVADDVVWISPGIPFLVPMFAGLLLSFTVGDLLFVVMDLAGLV
jgi:preflagellin peptidase FlaK